MEVQEKIKNGLIAITKQQAWEKSQKDKSFSMEKFKQPLLKWKIDQGLAETIIDFAFGKNSQTSSDMKPAIKKEFGRIKMYGKSTNKHG